MVFLQSLVLILLLAFLEGVLSIDNVLILALMTRSLRPDQRRRALSYGIVGAFVFRFFALTLATSLIQWPWAKWIGGTYLILIAIRHFWIKKVKGPSKRTPHERSFWKVVILVELTDLVFAVDSITAAVAITHQFWIIFLGGCLGILMMRLSSSLFNNVIDRYPNLETSAHLMVLIVGIKLFLEGFHLPGLNFQSYSTYSFWVFWSMMLASFFVGLRNNTNKIRKTKDTDR